MGRRKGRRRLTRKEKIQRSEPQRPEVSKELPPLSEDGKRIAEGVAPLEKIERIRKA